MVLDNSFKRGARNLAVLIGIALGGTALSARSANALPWHTFTRFNDSQMTIGLVNDTGSRIGRVEIAAPEGFSSGYWAGMYDDGKMSYVPEDDERDSGAFLSRYGFPDGMNLRDYFRNPLSGFLRIYGLDDNLIASARVAFPNLNGWSGRGFYRDVAQPDIPEGAPVPEPATLWLVGTGLATLAGFGRKKFKRI